MKINQEDSSNDGFSTIEMSKIPNEERKRSCEDTKVEDVCDLIGPFGLYQKLLTFWKCYLSFLAAMCTMDITFMAPDLKYRCLEPGFELSDDQCQLTTNTSSQVVMRRLCTSWNYTTDAYPEGSTLTEKFNLVCGRDWYISVASSAQQVGDLIAAFTVSYLSDRYGRRPVCVICLIPGAVALLMYVFVRDIEWFILAKFIYGFSGQSVSYLVMIIMAEITAEKYRGFISILGVTIGYSSGYVSLPILYWLIRDQHNFHLLLVATYASLLLFYWIIPESPRWLLVHGRDKDCFKLIKRIQKMNGFESNDKELEISLEKISRQIKIQSDGRSNIDLNFLDLFRTREMRKRSIILCLCWFICNLIYMGVALTANVLGGNEFWNVFYLAVIELPSTAFCLTAERYFGHKTLLMSALSITAVVYFATITIPRENGVGKIIMVVLGKFWVNSSFNFLYPYSTELFPTSLRSTGVGIAGGFSSLGGVISPFINQLVAATSVSVMFGVFGLLSIISAGTIKFLPETKYSKLPDTLGEIK